MDSLPRIAVTGATGYIGGRLVARLLDEGYAVRCLVRDARRLEGRAWRHRVELAEADPLRPETLPAALAGVSVAYYLIHSMAGGRDFAQRDLEAARHFAAAAKAAGVERIVYLGGLGDPAGDLSHHLRSRQDTGEALRSSGVPVTEFRAGVIVGSGSLSFEIIRYLTERVPVMICPRWVYTRTQPIAIRNVLEYLLAALHQPASAGRVIEIGGADVVTYGDMMRGYAEVRGLRRRLVQVPVLTPRLSSYWVHLVTPVPAAIAQPLIAGLGSEAVVLRPEVAREVFPDIHPLDYRAAVELALARLDAGEVETAWSDALSSSLGRESPVRLTSAEGMIVEQRRRETSAAPDAAFRVFSGLGGARGWLVWNRLWRLRGGLDRLLGGVGMRRGRRDAQELRVGDAVDFWRVEAVEAGRLVRFRAEMKVPGRAWLQFTAEPRAGGGSVITQTAFFASKGLAGFLYWYALYPLHAVIFRDMIKAVARAAERAESR
jgi:uncharacterized protein YbjT (DUF2867 family)